MTHFYQSYVVIDLITHMNLSAIDLNLLIMLHAVLEEQSATRAARRLHVTQSAVSNGLARLRRLLGDPLVVRSGRGLVATPRATEIQPVLQEVIARLEQVVDRRGFVPEASTRTFTIGLADTHQACDVPAIAAAFATRLPKATLRVVSADYLVAYDALTSGDVDVAFVPEQAVRPGQRSVFMFEERGALVLRRGHPHSRRKMTAEVFNALPQIDVQVTLGRPGVGHRVAGEQLKAIGLKRRITLTVPYFLTAALAAAQTDAVAVLPDRLAKLCCRILPLTIVPTVLPLPRLKTVMAWHERTDADAGAAYFRQLVVDAIREKKG
jgi:DNA-binding transcriptional LysR family regulator